MHTRTQLPPVQAAARPAGNGIALGRRVRALPARISAWIVARADRIGAELVWRELSKLSDEELAERGLTRATLARDVGAAVAERRKR
jgi:hypothetical protein